MKGYARRIGASFRVWDDFQMWYHHEDPNKMWFDYIILPNGQLGRLSWGKSGGKDRQKEGRERFLGDAEVLPPRTKNHDIMLQSPYSATCINKNRGYDHVYEGDILTRTDNQERLLLTHKNEGWFFVGADNNPKRLSLGVPLRCHGNIHEHEHMLHDSRANQLDNAPSSS